MTNIIIDDALINEVVTVSHYQNATCYPRHVKTQPTFR
jgi:hypothetical protein